MSKLIGIVLIIYGLIKIIQITIIDVLIFDILSSLLLFILGISLLLFAKKNIK